MPLPEDVIVRRSEAARVQLPYLAGVLKIGIIGRSRGKNTAATIEITRQVTDTDELKDYGTSEYANDPIRTVDKAVALAAGYVGEIFYPNIHFLVTKNSAILNPNNLGSNDTSSALALDWSVAPPLVPPSVEHYDIQSSTGGFSAAETVYYSLTVLDHNANESNIGSITKVEIPDPTPDTSEVVLTWRMVEYANSYKVYRGSLADGSDMGLIATISGKATVTFTDRDETSGAAPPSTNSTQAKPADGDKYTLHYKYGVIVKNTYKEFTTSLQVQEEHGIGSELANAAKIYMNPEYNNAPVIATVVPESDNYNSYLDAANQFKSNHVNFIIPLYAGSSTLSSFISNFRNFYNLAANLSDEIYEQKECYAFTGLPFKEGWTVNDVETFCTAFQATATEGKRGFFVVPEGFEMAVSTWVNEDGESQSDYVLTDPASIDITSILFAGACVARYCGFRDVSLPLTEKDIAGFTFKGKNFTAQEIRQCREAGAMVIENITGVAIVNQSINMSQPEKGIEDGEMSICVTEDWLKADLRRRIRPFRGQKMLGSVLRAIEDVISDALRQYLAKRIINYFVAGSVRAYQDETEKDRVIGSFIFMPVYPINKIAVEYTFTFVAL
jgi:hypothetical protein